MKQKIFSLLVLVMTAMTASADAVPAPAYKITVGTNEHGTFAFKVNDVDATLDDNNELAVDEGDEITLIITPETDWVVNAPSGEWHAVDAAARGHHRALDIDMERVITLTPDAGNATSVVKTYTFEMIRADAEISCTYRKLLTHPDITVEDITNLTFTGSELTQPLVIKDGGTTLVENEDYTVSYNSNVNAGMATVTITGIGNYAGEISFEFKIYKAGFDVSFPVTSVQKTVGDEPFTYALTTSLPGTVTYTSSDPTVATVDKNGLVTILHSGMTTISASVYVDENHETESASYRLEVKQKVIMGADGTQISWDGEAYNVAIDENVAPGTVIPEEFCNVHLSYHRVLTVDNVDPKDVEGETGYLFTICTPFAPQMYAKFYSLTSVNNGTLQFDEISGRPQAYTPYLVCVKEDASVKNQRTYFHPDGGSNSDGSSYYVEEYDNLDYISKQDMSFCNDVVNSAVVDGYQLCGTLRGMTNADAAAAGAFILQTDGSWGAVKAGNEAVYIPPFRAYIVAASAQSARLTSSFGEGGATGIERIVTTDLDGTERWYDLNGRRIEKPTTKGVYIQNGKKTVIK